MISYSHFHTPLTKIISKSIRVDCSELFFLDDSNWFSTAGHKRLQFGVRNASFLSLVLGSYRIAINFGLLTETGKEENFAFPNWICMAGCAFLPELRF